VHDWVIPIRFVVATRPVVTITVLFFVSRNAQLPKWPTSQVLFFLNYISVMISWIQFKNGKLDVGVKPLVSILRAEFVNLMVRLVESSTRTRRLLMSLREESGYRNTFQKVIYKSIMVLLNHHHNRYSATGV
jgi:hypothetical protein